MVLLLSSSFVKADNSITIDQIGDNLDMELEQEGDRHSLTLTLSGGYMEIQTRQYSTTSSTDQNSMNIDVNGSNNMVDVGQGCKFLSNTGTPDCENDTHEDPGHILNLSIVGNSNMVRGGQKSGTANPNHEADIDINSDNNSVFFTQAGSGKKDLDLTINNDGNTASIQQLYGTHTAAVTLDGTYPTNLNLIQTGSGTQSYTLLQNCITTGGCSVSVTQQ